MVINKEVKDHVYTANPNLCHVTKFPLVFTCRSGFTVHYFYTLISSFKQFFVHKNSFELFLAAHFLFIF